MKEITRAQFDEYCKALEKELVSCLPVDKIHFDRLYFGVITKYFLENEIALEQHGYYVFLLKEYFSHINSRSIPIEYMNLEFYVAFLLSSLGFIVIYETIDEETFPAPRHSTKDRIYHYRPSTQKEIEEFLK